MRNCTILQSLAKFCDQYKQANSMAQQACKLHHDGNQSRGPAAAPVRGDSKGVSQEAHHMQGIIHCAVFGSTGSSRAHVSLCNSSPLLHPPKTINPVLSSCNFVSTIPCPLLPEGLAVPCKHNNADVMAQMSHAAHIARCAATA